MLEKLNFVSKCYKNTLLSDLFFKMPLMKHLPLEY